MRPLVSIVVPIFQVEKYLEKCILSITEQTYKNLEIILVDDGSTDDSAVIANKYKSIDKRIKVINKQNGGLSDARNAGFKYCTGEYVLFVDGDDYIEVEAVEILVRTIESKNLDVVLFGFYIDKVDLKENILNIETVEVKTEDSKTFAKVLGYAWNKMYRVEFLKENKIIFEKGLSLIEDVVFNEMVYEKTSKIEYLNVPLYHYMDRERISLVKKYHWNSFELQKRGFYSRKKILNNIKLDNQLKNELISHAYIEAVRYCLSNLFYYKNDLNIFIKFKQVRKILSDHNTKEQVANYKPQMLTDYIILYCIKHKLVSILSSLYISNANIRKIRLIRKSET